MITIEPFVEPRLSVAKCVVLCLCTRAGKYRSESGGFEPFACSEAMCLFVEKWRKFVLSQYYFDWKHTQKL